MRNGIVQLLLLLTCGYLSSASDYCKISPNHTMCLYKTISVSCIQYLSATDHEAELILQDHNRARSDFAAGSKGFYVPDMLKMYWDQELADLSARWACQCKGSSDLDRNVGSKGVDFNIRYIRTTLSQCLRFSHHRKTIESIYGMFENGQLWVFRNGGPACSVDHTALATEIPANNHRFDVGQIVWSLQHPDGHAQWDDIWEYILSNGTGLYQRDDWGKTKISFHSTEPLSYIYNPSMKYLGCELAKYQVWSVKESRFLYSTTLVCNYGPLLSEYDARPEEDWPCSRCPASYPCFVDHYMKKSGVPASFQAERYLCLDPDLETMKPTAAKQCPSYSRSKVVPSRRVTDTPHKGNNDAADVSLENTYDDTLRAVATGYCGIRCSQFNHTMCQYKGLGKKCHEFLSLTNSMMISDVLELHNKFRDSYTAGGTDPPHLLASNMFVLTWNRELEKIANRWVMQCTLSYDKCRDAPSEIHIKGKRSVQRVSQNIGWLRYNKSQPVPSHRDIFAKWAAEAKKANFRTRKDFMEYDESANKNKSKNFVQLIWALTYEIGCGFGTFRDQSSHLAFLVCNYLPAGRRGGKSVMIPGGPCSKCFINLDFSYGRCLSKYPNLCSAAAPIISAYTTTITALAFMKIALFSCGT